VRFFAGIRPEVRQRGWVSEEVAERLYRIIELVTRELPDPVLRETVAGLLRLDDGTWREWMARSEYLLSPQDYAFFRKSIGQPSRQPHRENSRQALPFTSGPPHPSSTKLHGLFGLNLLAAGGLGLSDVLETLVHGEGLLGSVLSGEGLSGLLAMVVALASGALTMGLSVFGGVPVLGMGLHLQGGLLNGALVGAGVVLGLVGMMGIAAVLIRAAHQLYRRQIGQAALPRWPTLSAADRVFSFLVGRLTLQHSIVSVLIPLVFLSSVFLGTFTMASMLAPWLMLSMETGGQGSRGFADTPEERRRIQRFTDEQFVGKILDNAGRAPLGRVSP